MRKRSVSAQGTAGPRARLRAAARGVVVAVAVAAAALAAAACGQDAPTPSDEPQAGPRVVSLVPAATEMLFAVGAGGQVIAVSSFDERPEEVRALPKVGALLDPDVERILTLRPDLVVTYHSQDALERQLAQAGIETYAFVHGGLGDMLSTLEDLSAKVGHAEQGRMTANLLRARLDAVRMRVEGRPRPRVLLVFGREPGALRQVWASGGEGFLHDLLELAGAENVFADVSRENVQATTEQLLARAPDVIVELRRGDDASRDAQAVAEWAALASIPAVRDGRILRLPGDDFIVSGPRLADAAELLARALHPEAWASSAHSPTNTTSTDRGTSPFS
jgi:iron complex transport system substrate-binding protein